MNIRKSSTVVFLTALMTASIADLIEQDQKEALVACKRQNPVENPWAALTQNVTPSITKEYISQFIIGSTSQVDCNSIVDTIMEIRQIHPAIKNYIDLIFTHLPDMKISLVSPSELAEGTLAFYASFTKSILIPRIFTIDNFMHEALHAAWNTLHRLRGNEKSENFECYFPPTEEEKEKIKKMLEKGDAKLLELREMLKLEAKKELDKPGSNKLANLRRKTLKQYKKYYPINTYVVLPDGFIRYAEKKFNKKLSIGETYTFNFFLKDRDILYGDITITAIKEEQDEKVFYFKFNDPLYAAVNYMPQLKKSIVENYKEAHHFSEIDAFYTQHFPQELLKFVLEDFWNYRNQLFAEALAIPVPHKPPILTYMNEEETLDAELNDLANQENFQAINAYYYLATLIPNAASHGKFEQAKTGLKVLIQKGYYVGEANLLLARIYHHQGYYGEALTYFKRAEKRNVKFSDQDRKDYSDALNEENFFKTAKKQQKKIFFEQECEAIVDNEEDDPTLRNRI